MRCALAADVTAVGELLRRISVAGREATVNARGVAVAMPQGHKLGASLVDRFRGERGNHRWLPFLPCNQRGSGQARRRLMAIWWGGGSVVVGGRESRLQGEGSQRVCKEDAGMPEGRR
jgi:hypothetical protein